MTNRIALFLGLFVLAAISLSYLAHGTDQFLYLAKKFFALLEWVAFWR